MSRNDCFQSLVFLVADTLISTAIPPVPLFSTSAVLHQYSSAQLSALVPTAKNKSFSSLADVVAESIGNLSENITLSRGLVMLASCGKVCSYIYNAQQDADTGVSVGTYGSLVHLTPSEGDVFKGKVEEIGRLIGQHIVGMAPTQVFPNSENGNNVSTCSDTDTNVLVDQRYLLDQNISVGEWLNSHGVQVTSFVRFGLREDL